MIRSCNPKTPIFSPLAWQAKGSRTAARLPMDHNHNHNHNYNLRERSCCRFAADATYRFAADATAVNLQHNFLLRKA